MIKYFLLMFLNQQFNDVIPMYNALNESPTGFQGELPITNEPEIS